MKKYAALKESAPSRGSMKTELHIDKKTAPERRTRRWSAHREEKRESDVGVFVRSVLEMIRQQPGISRTEAQRPLHQAGAGLCRRSSSATQVRSQGCLEGRQQVCEALFTEADFGFLIRACLKAGHLLPRRFLLRPIPVARTGNQLTRFPSP